MSARLAFDRSHLRPCSSALLNAGTGAVASAPVPFTTNREDSTMVTDSVLLPLDVPVPAPAREDVFAYAWLGAEIHRECIGDAIALDERYEGWALGRGIRMDAESNLDEIAFAVGIDRGDLSAYDSAEFPVPLVESDVLPEEECGYCCEPLHLDEEN